MTQSPNPLPNPDLTLDTNHARKANDNSSINTTQYEQDSQYSRSMPRNEQSMEDKYDEIQNSTLHIPDFIDKNYDKVNYNQDEYMYDDQRAYCDGREMYNKQDIRPDPTSNNLQHTTDHSYNSKEHEYAMKSSNFLNDRCGLNVVPHNQYLTYSNNENVCNQDINISNTYCTEYPDVTDRVSVNSEKYNICDKYLFPYTGELAQFIMIFEVP